MAGGTKGPARPVLIGLMTVFPAIVLYLPGSM